MPFVIHTTYVNTYIQELHYTLQVLRPFLYFSLLFVFHHVHLQGLIKVLDCANLVNMSSGTNKLP
jgi:hypothetical protein